MLKMVIFDMDGVLVDACEWHKDALNDSLEEIAGFSLSEEEHIEHFNGLPTRVKLKKMVELGYISEEQIETIYTLKQDKTKDAIIKKGYRAPEKVDLLRWLKGHGIIVSCFTNSIRETAMMMLGTTGVASELEMVVTNQEVKNSKPHPEGYLKLLSHFGVDISEAFIIEDSPKGIQAARATGCKVMEVGNPTEVTIETVKEFISENFNSHGG